MHIWWKMLWKKQQHVNESILAFYSFEPSTFFEKHSILDIWQGSDYASDCN